MKLSEWIERFFQESEVGIVIDPSRVNACAIKAMNQYYGYADLESERLLLGDESSHVVCPSLLPNEPLGMEQELTVSEWAIIRPLFRLYVEFENAMHYEASRVLGVDVPGRASSEIQGDINAYELELSHKAYFHGAETI